MFPHLLVLRVKIFLGSLLLFFTLIANVNAQVLSLGVYTSDKPTVMYKKFKPIVDYLSKDLSERLSQDITINLKIYKTYQEAQNAIAVGESDFARFGPASYIQVKKKQPNIRLLVMENKNGKKSFNGVIVTKSNSTVSDLIDLKGKTFAFGNHSSTIGRYLAQDELIKADINGIDLKNYEYLGRHDKVFKAVSVGNFDAGSVKESTLKKYNKNKIVRVIHSFPNITKAWLAKAGMEEKVFQSLKQSLLDLKDENILKTHKVHGFFATSDNEYDSIRQAMKRSRQF